MKEMGEMREMREMRGMRGMRGMKNKDFGTHSNYFSSAPLLIPPCPLVPLFPTLMVDDYDESL
jgi:hypothetical protein